MMRERYRKVAPEDGDGFARYLRTDVSLAAQMPEPLPSMKCDSPQTPRTSRPKEVDRAGEMHFEKPTQMPESTIPDTLSPLFPESAAARRLFVAAKLLFS